MSVILGIETTCDETAVAIVKNGIYTISQCTISQIKTHAIYGGVIPEIASRQHLQLLPASLNEALVKSNITPEEIDAIAVATEPGLVPALNVGISFASGVAMALGKKLVPVNHLHAHVWANFMNNDELIELKNIGAALCLLVSGGHTQLLEISFNQGLNINIIGETQDDAVGEAYDKIAKLLSLPYPGGPQIEKIAIEGDSSIYKFPRPMLWEDNNDFSFSGLKSHVARLVLSMKDIDQKTKANIARCFQDAVLDVLTTKVINYGVKNGYKKIYLAGGVACNNALRNSMREKCTLHSIDLKYPPISLCTDNAEMIAGLGGMIFDVNLPK